MRLLNSLTDSMDKNLREPWETLEARGAWHAAGHRVTKSPNDFETEA